MLLDYLNFLRKTILETWEAVRVYLKKKLYCTGKGYLKYGLEI